jgi:hypothetical protein
VLSGTSRAVRRRLRGCSGVEARNSRSAVRGGGCLAGDVLLERLDGLRLPLDAERPEHGLEPRGELRGVYHQVQRWRLSTSESIFAMYASTRWSFQRVAHGDVDQELLLRRDHLRSTEVRDELAAEFDGGCFERGGGRVLTVEPGLAIDTKAAW